MTARLRKNITQTTILAAAVLLAAFTGLGAAPAAQPAKIPEVSVDLSNIKSYAVHDAFAKVVAPALPSTVRILCDGRETSLGTVVAADGLILTKASELRGKITCRLHDGKSFDAQLIRSDQQHDLALLKIDAAGLTPITWADAAKVEVGQWVAIPGCPPGAGETVVGEGIISLERRKIDRGPGVIGRIGVSNEKGKVIVTEIFPGTPAAVAGMQVGDVITGAQGVPISGAAQIIQEIMKLRAGDDLALDITRGDEKLTATVKLDPADSIEQKSMAMDLLAGPLSKRKDNFPAVLQHDTYIQPTDCGGPLVDLDGKAIGINIARASRTATYALPADVVLRVLTELRSAKSAPATQPAK